MITNKDKVSSTVLHCTNCDLILRVKIKLTEDEVSRMFCGRCGKKGYLEIDESFSKNVIVK